MWNIILTILLGLACILILYLVYRNFISIKQIDEIKKNKTIKRCNLYENIFDNFIKPESFLFMTNEGSNLCDTREPITYIDYDIQNYFC